MLRETRPQAPSTPRSTKPPPLEKTVECWRLEQLADTCSGGLLFVGVSARVVVLVVVGGVRDYGVAVLHPTTSDTRHSSTITPPTFIHTHTQPPQPPHTSLTPPAAHPPRPTRPGHPQSFPSSTCGDYNQGPNGWRDFLTTNSLPHVPPLPSLASLHAHSHERPLKLTKKKHNSPTH
ncbi:hypothetical protein E2C01_024515 [Portunus trituberculatus]|uniref:Uncharacterized protein n=1 Tax=Portunus trituberculatus TaxID=210409 RepID=A0A5B7EAT1_PORTR|nr:hypothetical protein [Portunus trituberculatus]